MRGDSAQGGNSREDADQEVASRATGYRCTIASYEGCAWDYARSTEPQLAAEDPLTLVRFLQVLPSGGRVLRESWSKSSKDADGRWLTILTCKQ